MCDAWLDFVSFLTDMGVRPAGTTLDRIDTSGNYEPANCRWATSEVQQANKRNLKYVGAVLAKAIELRASGYGYRDIDAHFGFEPGGAWYALKKRRGL